MEEATKHGINAEKLPKILLNVCGMAGAKTPIWRRMRINIKSKTIGKQHLEEVYLSENTKHNIMSYETLQNLGYIRTENTGRLKTIIIGRTITNTYKTEAENHHTRLTKNATRNKKIRHTHKVHIQ